MAREKSRQARNDLPGGDAGRQGHAQDSAQLAGAAGRLIGFLESVEERLDSAKVFAARLGENDCAGRSRQEWCTYFALQRGDDPRRRGLRDGQLAPGAREAPSPGNTHEQPQRREKITHVKDE